MKYLIPILCAVVTLLCGCTKEGDAPEIVVNADQISLFNSQNVRYFKGGPFTGVAVIKYGNGQKHGEITYKRGHLVTITVWKPNGEKCPDTNVVDGRGIWCWYYENGQKEVEIKRTVHSFFQSIGWDGLETSWHENGQKRTEQPYKDGKAHGLRTVWHENGQKANESTSKNGKKHGPWTTWYENGQKRTEENYKDGKKDGPWTWYYENGQKSYEQNYKDGKWDGPYTEWDEAGNPLRQNQEEGGQKPKTEVVVDVDQLENLDHVAYFKEKPFTGIAVLKHHNGRKGLEITYKDGKKDLEITYKDGKKDGLWTWYYENGQKKMEWAYKDGKRLTLKEWDENGNPID
jgi:antitoxin component YwqK of YwqJK toxin-antitoxin module